MVNTFVLQTSVLKGYVENKILKNVGNIVAGSHWLPLYFFLSIQWKLMTTSNCLATDIIQNIFCFQQEN